MANVKRGMKRWVLQKFLQKEGGLVGLKIPLVLFLEAVSDSISKNAQGLDKAIH
ncbi:hypothetical protein KSC_000270 [Ktedonobacter sp. SOSP1-52]|nr:hypothetical protein KSC_000270 [Ktedonobacter sp. SOSP1-52]